LVLKESPVKARSTDQIQAPPSRSRSLLLGASFSVLLIIPCFWQSRIQSADLGSHIYNAWLATQIHRDALPGLWISPRSNNVLFDVLLEWLFVRVGPDWAQRIAVSACVLTFGWGAIQFIFRVAGRNWWFAAPCVAMLAYGYIFRIGFFNFYLSMGLCLWFLTVVWEKSWKLKLWAAPLLMIAWVAHPFPVVWTVGISVFVTFARFRGERGRVFLWAAGFFLIVLVRCIVTHRYRYEWSLQQAFFVTGATQLSTFSRADAFPLAGLLFVWLSQLRRLIKHRGIRGVVFGLPFQLSSLNAAAVFLIPNQIMFPQFERQFGYITTRLSLEAALLICGLLAAVRLTNSDKTILLVTAALFFGISYHSELQLNRFETLMDRDIESLPAMQRVIVQGPAQSLRWLCFQHDLDRACVERCFSYANYEPSSGQFRIHALPDNGIVLSDNGDVDAVRTGQYSVQARDLPMYLIYLCGSGYDGVCSRSLRAGEISGKP
jgi:hypothetical protein